VKNLQVLSKAVKTNQRDFNSCKNILSVNKRGWRNWKHSCQWPRPFLIKTFHFHPKAECPQVQTIWLSEINLFLFGHIISILFTELSWSLWENIDLGREYRSHCVCTYDLGQDSPTQTSCLVNMNYIIAYTLSRYFLNTSNSQGYGFKWMLLERSFGKGSQYCLHV